MELCAKAIDNTTRYNLEVCKRQLKEQKKKENERDKNKKEKGTDKNQKDKNDKQQQQDKQDNSKMSKENALQLLNAAIQQEKNTQERMKKALQQPRSRKLEKNW